MRSAGYTCRFRGCDTHVMSMQTIGPDDPEWMREMIRHGYCVQHAILEFSNLVPVVRPDPGAEYHHWMMIDGEWTPLEEE